MIEWLKTLANQIIIAVIIAVIFDLILPNGKNKKYIKMLINLYVLFVILNPIISKITNQNFDITNKLDYNQYFSDATTETSIQIDNNNLIENTYQKSLKENIINKVESEGYKVSSISIDINKNESDENYGSIKKIILNIESKETVDDSNIEIEDVKISSNNETISNKSLKNVDRNKIKKILTEEYQIDQKNIEIY